MIAPRFISAAFGLALFHRLCELLMLWGLPVIGVIGVIALRCAGGSAIVVWLVQDMLDRQHRITGAVASAAVAGGFRGATGLSAFGVAVESLPTDDPGRPLHPESTAE